MDKEALAAFARKIISIPSYSGHEKDVADTIDDKMRELGFDEVRRVRYGSVIGCIHGSQPGPRILMDGHIDTVDVIDRDEWQHDPFGAEVADGKIYGRGASDMKGSVAAMVYAASCFADHGFAGDIYVSCTVHEECFEGVSSREVTKAVHPDFVIIGEATSTTVKIGQRGRAEVVVETEGVSCHSSNPEKGSNAVYAMMSVIDEIRKIVPNEHPLLGKGILELTDIISYPYPGASVVPSLCRATFDRRTLVGETKESVLAAIDEAIARAQAKDPSVKARAYIAKGAADCYTGERIEAERYFPAWITDEGNPFVQKALKGLRDAGIEAPISHFSFCTNGSHFAGEAGIPAIGYGPSLESLAHVRDEYIEIRQLEKAAEGFCCILRELVS